MARINPIEPQEAPPVVKSLYETLRADLGIEPNNFFKTMAHNPELLRPLIEFSRVMLEGGLLPRRLKEWVILQIGRAHQCDYVYNAHKMALSRALMGDVLGDTGPVSLDASSLKKEEQLAIRYAGQITANNVEDETFKEVQATFSTPELIELTVLASYYNFICRTVNALQIDPDKLTFLEPLPQEAQQ
jgi:alkylhydroperoxidase family enzyme